MMASLLQVADLLQLDEIDKAGQINNLQQFGGIFACVFS